MGRHSIVATRWYDKGMYNPVAQCTRCSGAASTVGEDFTRRLRARHEYASAAAESRPVQPQLAMKTGELYRIPRVRPPGDETPWASLDTAWDCYQVGAGLGFSWVENDFHIVNRHPNALGFPGMTQGHGRPSIVEEMRGST